MSDHVPGTSGPADVERMKANEVHFRAQPDSDHSKRPRHWNYAQVAKPDFADFTEPFCAGWNAHRTRGDMTGEQFSKVLMDAYENSGAMLAYRVVTGQMSEDEARAQMGRPASDEEEV